MSARPALPFSGPSRPPYDAFNVGNHVDDDPSDVARHRQDLATALNASIVWMRQVHGHRALRLTHQDLAQWVGGPGTNEPEADGALTTEPGLVCAVMVADCLPVLLAAPEGRGVAALHAGWRGLAGAGDSMKGRGIVDTGVAALCEAASCDPADLQAWLGPCIGPTAFEVGADVLQGFGVDPAQTHPRFVAQTSRQRWWADLPGLATDRLRSLGVSRIEGGQWCTVSQPSRFFSFRRDGVTGRQVACIWLEGGGV
jgi:YfiH family protein